MSTDPSPPRSDEHPLGPLTYGRLTFVLQTHRRVQLPEYLGSTLRGALMTALRELSCTQPGAACKQCPALQECPYAWLLETPRPPWAAKRKSQGDPPRPVILEPPPRRQVPWEAGECLCFSLVLVGRRALSAALLLAASVEQMCQHGLGQARHPFNLREAWASTSPGEAAPLSAEEDGALTELSLLDLLSPPPETGAATVEFITPTRLVKGRVSPDPDFSLLASRLLDRLDTLLDIHCGQALDHDALRRLKAHALQVRPVKQQRTVDHRSRWSNRQGRHIWMDGVVGQSTWAGEGIAPLWPYLQAGQLLHVGKGTTMGLGRYQVRPASRR